MFTIIFAYGYVIEYFFRFIPKLVVSQSHPPGPDEAF